VTALTEPAKTPFVPTDLLKFEFVGDPQVSPDGERVAYVRTTIDPKTNKHRSVIMVAPVRATGGGAGGKTAEKPAAAAAVPFTSGITPDSHPRWSPDGRWLAFLSGRDAGVGDEEAKKKAGAQIWVAPTAGGEARPITAIKGGAGGFVWSPDSSHIAFTAFIKPEGPEWLDPAPGDKKDEKKEDGEAVGETGEKDTLDLETLFKKHNEDVKHITRIFYRLDGVGYLENRRSHVFTVDVQAALAGPPEKGPAVRPVRITSGDFDHSEPAYSPDGRFLAVAACRDENPDLQQYQDIWVFKVPVGAGGATVKPGEDESGEPEDPKRLTRGTGPFHAPSWSPDGGRIAFLGHEREHVWYSDDKIWLAAVGPEGAPQGEPKCLTKSFGRSFGDQSITDMRVAGGDSRPVWAPDGKTLFLPASDHGTTHLHAVNVATGQVSQLTTGDRVIFGWSADARRKNFAFSVATAESPNEICLGQLPGYVNPGSWPSAPAAFDAPWVVGLEPITESNSELMATRLVSLPERFSFSAPGGPPIDGWAMKPAGWVEGRKYPTVLQIHGGPMAMYTGTFFFEFQLLAAAGMGVIWTNPRGSQGYGEEFCAGIREEWGVNDYADIMAGVDSALKKFSWIDPDRLGVAGGSYGGYMTSWIIGHNNRFKAACSMRAVNNCHSFYGTSDTGYQWDDIWHGKPWDGWENLIRQSPITYVGNVKTPTLIIHSENDHRCIIEQGEQMFTALKKLGIEAEFLRYPNESHGLSRGGQPWHRVHRLRSIVDWFARHLVGEKKSS
jgi:dipeptidyl aminopeptidase/acylaminoacyl peptidase